MAQDRSDHSSRKAEYLEAIIAQLMSTGFNDLSLRELAGQVGTSHRVLIYHFVSKENLVNEVVQEVRRRERVRFEGSGVLDSDHLSEGLVAFFEHNISAGMRPYFRLFYEVWGIAQTKPDVYARFLDGIISVWVDTLSPLFERAGYDSERAVARATVVLATLRGLQLDLFTTGEEERVKTAFLSLVTLIQGEVESLARNPLNPEGSPEKKHQENGEAT